MEAELLKIFIVEDELSHAEAITRAFGTAGFAAEVRVAGSLSEYRRMLREWQPDIALMDLNLADGRASEALISPPENGPFPIVIMTSFGNEHIAVEAIKAGALDYVVKSSEAFRAMPRTLERVLREWKLLQERKNAVTALKQSEKFVHDILASVDEAFVVVDRGCRILSANRAYCEQAGKPLESILGRHCYEISHYAARPCYELGQECGCKRTFETGESAITVLTRTDANGRQRHIEIRTYAIKDESEQINSIIEIITDITGKMAMENQLRHAQKMEGIGTLAGGIAHDFNNILTAIIGYGNVALMKIPKDDPLRSNIEHILKSADRAAALTHNLLTFSRKQALDRKPVDLNKILARVEQFLARVIGEDVEIRMALDAGALTIFGDAGQLEQAFMSLGTNARDAMPKGGIFTIEATSEELDNRFIADHGYGNAGAYAMVIVSDTGAGMNEDTRKKVFEPFFTTREVGKGTGLGLAMVYGIIKQHDGFINVYSEPGKGTAFRIYLPLITTEAAGGLPAVEPDNPQGGTETVLLAEDDPHVRAFTALVLEQMGYSVITANDGEEAVAKFYENKDSIQLLLLDILMPKRNGREAYEEIRKTNPDIPVLFASGYSPEVLRQKSLLEDGAAIVFKPVSPQELLKKVRAALEKKGR